MTGRVTYPARGIILRPREREMQNPAPPVANQKEILCCRRRGEVSESCLPCLPSPATHTILTLHPALTQHPHHPHPPPYPHPHTESLPAFLACISFPYHSPSHASRTTTFLREADEGLLTDTLSLLMISRGARMEGLPRYQSCRGS